MKVLILNGSPRRHGNMSKMLELMKQELEGCGVGTVYIDVPQLQVCLLYTSPSPRDA